MSLEFGRDRRVFQMPDTPKEPVDDTVDAGPADETAEARERGERGNRISEFLSSKDFLEKIRLFEKDKRPAAIGACTEYFELHPDGYNIDTFIERIRETPLDGNLLDTAHSEILVSSVAERLGLHEPLREDDCRKIFSYLTDRLVKNGVYYHAFNGVFEESITTNGLRPNAEIANIDVQERNEIIDIGKRHGIPMILGWRGFKNQDAVFYEGNGHNMYEYGTRSPEWFDEFVTDGARAMKDDYFLTAYKRRDYAASRQNIERMCASMKSATEEQIAARKRYPNLTHEEEQKILMFFEKYWTRFANEKSKPKVARIRASYLRDVEKEMEFYTFDEAKRLDQGRHVIKDQKSDIELCRFLCDTLRSGSDLSSKEPIPPQELTIVTLPSYADVYPEIVRKSGRDNL